MPLAESVGPNPFNILIATILSARTRDETTARVCQQLFKTNWRRLTIKEIESIIKPVNFYHNKARYLRKLAGLKQVPRTLSELIALPGVGRKTANIVLNTAFNHPAIAVDTHVHRITNRLGYVQTSNPFETEQALRSKLPLKHWSEINYLLVLFGQHVCKPRQPMCSKCPLINCHQALELNNH